ATSATAAPTATEAAPPINTPLDPAVAAEIRRLNPQAVLATSPHVASDVRAALPGVKVVETGSELPKTSTPAGLAGLSVLVPADDELRAGALAAKASALAAGADVVGAKNGDPRSGACAVKALSGAHPKQVLAVGD